MKLNRSEVESVIDPSNGQSGWRRVNAKTNWFIERNGPLGLENPLHDVDLTAR